MEAERREGGASDDVRTRRKQAKHRKKMEKKARREEEFLRELKRPKSTKVTLAERNFLESISTGSGGNRTGGSFEFSNFDFPELSSSTSQPRKSKSSKTPTGDDSRTVLPPTEGISGSEAGEVVDRGKGKPEESISTPKRTFEIRKGDKKNQIVLNLEDLIAKKSPKQTNKESTKLRPAIKSNALSANMLDSSNPKRHRGKHRETEKRRTLSKFKLAIIGDRIMSLKGRESKSRNVELSREQFKLELDLYLSDLMKKLKLAKAERAARKTETEQSTEVVGRVESAEPGKKGKSRKTTKYRKYCDNKYSEDLDKAVNSLVQCIVYLQDRAFGKNPVKAKAKPRHVVGLRNVKKCLMLHKLKMIIVAPDLEAQESVFNAIEELKSSSDKQNVPCVFALSRRQLGYASKKSVPVSAFGIISYDGLEDKFAAVREKLKEAQDRLKESQRTSEAESEHSSVRLEPEMQLSNPRA